MNSLVKVMRQEEENLKTEIMELLGRIENLSSLEFAKECEVRLTHKTHNYFVTGYIGQLKRVIKLLEAGAEPMEAIIIVDNCIDIETYIEEQLGKEKRSV
ncbi:MAG: hypothetical protein IKL07_00445 [Clostridium sp.]|nr:hypothetical protein [Clostridium sp.]